MRADFFSVYRSPFLECYLAMKFCKLIAHSSIFGAKRIQIFSHQQRKRIQIFLILFSNLFLNLLFMMGVDEHGHHNAVLRWYHVTIFTCLMPFPIHITKWSNFYGFLQVCMLLHNLCSFSPFCVNIEPTHENSAYHTYLQHDISVASTSTI